MQASIIRKKSHAFGVKILRFAKILRQKKEYVIHTQLIQSGTSIGANVREAQSGFSREDVIHKFTISLKQAQETRYWLE